MRNARFEWDDRKAAINLRKHRIAFEAACLAFDDANAFDQLDDDEVDEERWLVTGFVRDVLITVCYVDRGTRKRIISARRATQSEREDYNQGAT